MKNKKVILKFLEEKLQKIKNCIEATENELMAIESKITDLELQIATNLIKNNAVAKRELHNLRILLNPCRKKLNAYKECEINYKLIIKLIQNI